MLTDMKLITAVKSEVMVMIGSRISTQISPKDMKGTIKKVMIPNFMMVIRTNHKANTRISEMMTDMKLSIAVKSEVMMIIGSRISTQISPKDMKGTIKKVMIPNFMMVIRTNHKANTRISEMMTDIKMGTAVKSEVMVMIGSRIRTQISPKDMKGTIKKVTIPNFMMLICINHKANTRISKEMIELILKLKKEEVMIQKNMNLSINRVNKKMIKIIIKNVFKRKNKNIKIAKSMKIQDRICVNKIKVTYIKAEESKIL